MHANFPFVLSPSLSFFFGRHHLFWIHPLKYAYVPMPYTRYSSLAVLYSCAFCVRCLNISVNLCVNIFNKSSSHNSMEREIYLQAIFMPCHRMNEYSAVFWLKYLCTYDNIVAGCHGICTKHAKSIPLIISVSFELQFENSSHLSLRIYLTTNCLHCYKFHYN